MLRSYKAVTIRCSLWSGDRVVQIWGRFPPDDRKAFLALTEAVSCVAPVCDVIIAVPRRRAARDQPTSEADGRCQN